MPISNVHHPTVQLDGVVRWIDMVGRELHVHAAGAAVVFDVPPGCPVRLRGERVKLRLIQPRDRVRVAYTQSQERRVAGVIDIQPTESAA